MGCPAAGNWEERKEGGGGGGGGGGVGNILCPHPAAQHITEEERGLFTRNTKVDGVKSERETQTQTDREREREAPPSQNHGWRKNNKSETKKKREERTTTEGKEKKNTQQ